MGAGKKAGKPNIIFILIDDMGWTDIGCFGSSFYETPNIDALARDGMLFTDAYAACPVCSPTRASLMSGKYPATVGVTDWIDHDYELHPVRASLIDAPYIRHLPLSEKSVASALRDGGYATWHVGKWHLGTEEFWPTNHGFDVNIGGTERGTPGKGYFPPYGIKCFEDGPEGEYLTDRITDEAIRLIKSHDGSKPYYLNLCHFAVHEPIQVKAEDVPKYERKREAMGLDKVTEFEDGEVYPVSPEDRQLRIRRRLVQGHPGYAAMVENLDMNVGRLLEAVRETGGEDDTIVVFTSDNGGVANTEPLAFLNGNFWDIREMPTSNKPLSEGKGWMYEGGVREPLIIKWPSVIKPGGRCPVPVTTPDFYPTLLEAAGLPLIPEQHVDGESILPLLKGGDSLKRDAIFWHYPHYGNQGGEPGSSVRMGDWKLIEFHDGGRLELYNLRDDIGEDNDLAAEMPDKVAEMHGRLKAWRESVGARMPERNPDWWRAKA
ncbi:MAG: sulfatase [Oscillospiraceae bacterium]|nr:sulfatase [Oscillospiraceae bacterium]